MWIPVDVLWFWIEGSVGNWQCTTLRVVHAYAVLLDYKGRWSKQNSMATRLVLLAPSEVRPSFLWCQLHQLNSFSNFWTTKRWNDLGPLNPVAVGCTQNPPTRIRPSFWKLSHEVFPVLASPADAEPVASCEEHGVLGPIVGTVGSLAALEAIKVWNSQLLEFNFRCEMVQDERWSKSSWYFFGCTLFLFFFSRDFWMISWSWSWCQVLVKDSALHKSCLRGKLLLFDPTSSLHPCRTVRIKRPELQFSFCWFLVFDLSTLSCFANGFWNPSNVLWIPLDLRFQQVFSVLSLWFQALRVRCVQATELCRMCTQRWCPSNASDLCDRIAAGGSECFGLLQGSKHRYLGGLFSDSHDMIWVLQVCD